MPAELIQTPIFIPAKQAKEVVSDSPGLVDFATGLVNSVLNLPDGQVKFFGEFTVFSPAHRKKFFGPYKVTLAWARTY